MSPFRLVPLHVLQENILQIDELQLATAQTPADNDPWSIQLLELLDQSISNHFPRFDHPKWELPHPDLQSFNPEGREEEKYSTPDFGHHIPDNQRRKQNPVHLWLHPCTRIRYWKYLVSNSRRVETASNMFDDEVVCGQKFHKTMQATAWSRRKGLAGLNALTVPIGLLRHHGGSEYGY